MVRTPKFETPFFGASGQKDGETGNDLLRLFDSLTHPLVVDKDLTSPPASPDEGATYIVGGSATGAWAGQDDNLAVYFYGSWDFVVPWNGLTVWVDDESVEYRWETNAWVQVSAGAGTVTGSGASPQVAYWASASALTGDANFTYSSGTLNVEGETESTHFTEDVNVIGGVSDPQAIDITSGQVVTATVGGNVTFTFNNPASSGKSSSFTLVLTNGGSATVTWPASVKWENGSAPALTTSGIDVLMFFTTDGGTSWYGFFAGVNMQ